MPIKIFSVTILFAALCSNSFALDNKNYDDIYYYYFNENSGKYEYHNLGNIKAKKDILSFIADKLKKRFNISLNYSIITQIDDNQNLITGYIIDIKTNDNISKLFNWEFHSSYVIGSVCINFLQPKEYLWPINYIILKINGTFINYLDTDITLLPVLNSANFNSKDLYDSNTYPEEKKR